MSQTEIRTASVPLLVASDAQRDEQGPAGVSPVVASPAMPTLEGHFAVWNEWARIAELGGEFMERIAPGAFARSLSQDRNKIRILFQHGRDPNIGSKPLGIPAVLREDERGAFYSVPLLDTEYVRELAWAPGRGLRGLVPVHGHAATLGRAPRQVDVQRGWAPRAHDPSGAGARARPCHLRSV